MMDWILLPAFRQCRSALNVLLTFALRSMTRHNIDVNHRGSADFSNLITAFRDFEGPPGSPYILNESK
jgi:hypothetical protein